jgi:UDP-N-acetylmuramyl pentapeptide phosphotransferase/UDP-N-acetylglucosamine-1-phosphate transferase
MFTALVVGLADDSSRGGISARFKLGLQVLPAFAFACGNDTPLAAMPALALVSAVAAQNLANTYDNADGVLLASAALAFAPARPAWSAICLVLLASNLRLRGRAEVLLGDSGSHLIALMLLCEPRAWGAFFVPAVDLARVVLLRRSQGRAWWIGDRAHLAHRLQARGLSPPIVVTVLCLVALPAILAFSLFDGPLAWAIGSVSSLLAFLGVLRATPAVDGRGNRV